MACMNFAKTSVSNWGQFRPGYDLVEFILWSVAAAWPVTVRDTQRALIRRLRVMLACARSLEILIRAAGFPSDDSLRRPVFRQ